MHQAESTNHQAHFPPYNVVAATWVTLSDPDWLRPLLGGDLLPGSHLVRGGYNHHRLKSIWSEDADDFKLDRWKTFKLDNQQYLPFGGGPRSCLGRTKAFLEASYLVVRITSGSRHTANRDTRAWTG